MEIWGAAIAAVGAYASSRAKSKAEEKAAKNAEELSELGFQRKRWLDEQQQKFKLEERQYTQDNIAGFRGMAPESALSFNGQPIVNPTRTDTSGLANFNPNEEGLMDEFGKPKKGAPLMRSAGGY